MTLHKLVVDFLAAGVYGFDSFYRIKVAQKVAYAINL